MPATRACAMAVLMLVSATVALAEAPPPVGDLGDPARLTIIGAEAFAAETIKRELYRDLEIANAAYRNEPFDRFARLMAEKTVDGYQGKGFFQCQASASVDRQANRLVLTIKEGPRYRAGEIEVTGCRFIKSEPLRRRLIAPSKSPSIEETVSDMSSGYHPQPGSHLRLHGYRKAVSWCIGEYAELDRYSQAGLVEAVEQSLSAEGRSFANFEIRYRPDPNKRTIDLLIHIKDEGRPATIDRVVFVSGQKRNAHDDILRFAGLAEGTLLTDAVLQEATKRLSGSGRFTKSEIKVEPPANPTEPLTVVFDVEEYDRAPLLGQELSREESALEKLGRWLQQFGDSQEEMVVEFHTDGLNIEFVAAPRKGALAIVRKVDGQPRPTDEPTWAFLMTDHRAGFYSGKRRAKLEMGTIRSPIWLQIAATLHDVVPHSGKGGTVGIGLGMKSSPVQKSHCRLKFGDTPASMLALAHQPDSRMTWRGTVLTVEFADRRFELDAETGRPLAATFGKTEATRTTLRSERGVFDRRLHQIDSWAATWQNVAESESPVTAAVTFVCDEAISSMSTPECKFFRDPIAAWRKATSAGLLKGLDHLVLAASREEESRFCVPDLPDCLKFDSESMEMIRFIFSRIGICRADELFPRGSWAWTLWRESMFKLAGSSGHFHDELGREFAHRTAGPLRNLCASVVLRALGMTVESRVAARQGLAHLNIEDFRRDYLALLCTDSFVAECLHNTAAAMRELDDKEISHLMFSLDMLNLLDVEQAAGLSVRLSRLRREAAGLATTDLRQTFDACWDTLLAREFELLLTDLAAENPPSRTAARHSRRPK
ncbi:MAG TPA: hypothetical protein VHC22_30660 [Pirellulales bacterium]|nr:hypothetical protein [Pirellulales bacterium]